MLTSWQKLAWHFVEANLTSLRTQSHTSRTAHRVTRSVLVQDYEEGGRRCLDVECFARALRVRVVRSLVEPGQHPYRRCSTGYASPIRTSAKAPNVFCSRTAASFTCNPPHPLSGARCLSHGPAVATGCALSPLHSSAPSRTTRHSAPNSRLFSKPDRPRPLTMAFGTAPQRAVTPKAHSPPSPLVPPSHYPLATLRSPLALLVLLYAALLPPPVQTTPVAPHTSS